MSYGDDDWFPYEFNIRTDSPEAAGNFNYEAGNIDNIPLNDDGPLTPEQGLELDLAGPIDDYQYDSLRISPNGALNGQNQQPGTSGNNDLSGEQFQNMHVMQNSDTFDQHMQPSTSIEYNSFEMPTVINSAMDGGPYQDLGIDDPNSYYANQQPSTSQGNDLIMNENYDMISQSTSYMSHMDHVNSSSTGNPSSHSIMNQQNDNIMQVQQPPPKPKPKKRAPPKKKPAAAADTVGNVLNQMNKMNQQIENNNENRGVKVETRLSQEDAVAVGQLMVRMNMLREEEKNGNDRAEDIANIEAELARLFSVNISQSTNDAAGNVIVNEINQIKNMNNGIGSSSSQVQQNKKAPPKKKNAQNTRNIQQQSQQQQMNLPPQAQMTPAKIVMDPPTTTMVPSNSSHMTNMYNDGVNENYMYQPMDEQGTSQQQYNDYQQSESQDSILHQQNQSHQQIIQAKVVPTMSQRTHNYRQNVIFPSQNNNGPGPSPQLHQPQSHESQHIDQMHDNKFYTQDHQRPHSRQMYIPVHQQDGQMYQSHEPEPTLGDVVRQTQGRYQGPQDAPNLRQQLISNVNASTNKQLLQRSQDPTPSPGNFHSNSSHQPPQQYAEPFQNQESYPSSHDMQPHSHSQQGYESQNQYDTGDEFYDVNQVQSQESQMMNMQTDSQDETYEEQEMFVPQEDQEQMIESDEFYPEVPECRTEESKEKLEEKLEEKD
uniref:GLTSCR1 domain-containing protein n=1 Tax=Caenorhabditis tropicalis TaxID=1561998 RepID=A0A1I7T532_9PELO